MLPEGKTSIREWEALKKELVQKSYVGDDRNSLKFDLRFKSQQQRSLILRLKILNLRVPRK